MAAFDEKYRYSMKLSEMDANVDYYEAVDKAIETVFDRNISGADISSDYLQHEMVKEACKMLGIQYERVSL